MFVLKKDLHVGDDGCAILRAHGRVAEEQYCRHDTGDRSVTGHGIPFP